MDHTKEMGEKELSPKRNMNYVVSTREEFNEWNYNEEYMI